MKLLIKAEKIPSMVAEYQGDLVLRLTQKLLGSTPQPEWLDTELAASIYYAFYLPLPQSSPAENEDEIEKLKTVILKSILEDAGFWRVKPQTVVDRVTSLVASASLLERVVRNMPRSSQQGPSESEGGSMNEQVRKAVSMALKQAEADSRIARRVESLINSSLVGNTSELAFEDVLEAILRLARKTDVARVFEKLSGLKIPSKFARKTERFSRGWMEGIELGGDIERVHPTQLALPDELFYTLYAESRLLLYRRVYPLREGPLYVLLDKSGSMSGNKIDWARAVAIALFQTALKENRPFYIRFFDAAPHALLSIRSKPKPRDVIKLLEYLGTVKASGGTDITRAVAASVSDVENGRTPRNIDVVLITDGEDRLSVSVLTSIITKGKAKLHTIMIGGDNPSLKSVSTSYMSVEKLTGKEILKVIEIIEKSSREEKHRKL